MSQLDIFGGEILMVDQVPAEPRRHEWKVGRPWERCVCGLERSAGSNAFEDVPCRGEIPIYMSVEIDVTFAPGDLWPDGDWPESITTDTALAKLREHPGGLGPDLLIDYGLELDFRVQVDGDKSVRVSG